MASSPAALPPRGRCLRPARRRRRRTSRAESRDDRRRQMRSRRRRENSRELDEVWRPGQRIPPVAPDRSRSCRLILPPSFFAPIGALLSSGSRGARSHAPWKPAGWPAVSALMLPELCESPGLQRVHSSHASAASLLSGTAPGSTRGFYPWRPRSDASVAHAINCATEPTSALVIRLWRWFSTVLTEISRSAAIALLVLPAMIERHDLPFPLGEAAETALELASSSRGWRARSALARERRRCDRAATGRRTASPGSRSRRAAWRARPWVCRHAR